MNLRKFAAPKSVSQNVDPNPSPTIENEQNQPRRLRNGKKLPEPNPSTSQKTKNRSTLNKKKHDHPGSPRPESQIPHPQQAPNTLTDSDVAAAWRNLDNPFSYSGNTATILDQIKSFS